MEEGILVLQPLHHVRREGGLLGVGIETLTLLNDDLASVVL
jgi:hypothetical protein